MYHGYQLGWLGGGGGGHQGYKTRIQQEEAVIVQWSWVRPLERVMWRYFRDGLGGTAGGYGFLVCSAGKLVCINCAGAMDFVAWRGHTTMRLWMHTSCGRGDGGDEPFFITVYLVVFFFFVFGGELCEHRRSAPDRHCYSEAIQRSAGDRQAKKSTLEEVGWCGGQKYKKKAFRVFFV